MLNLKDKKKKNQAIIFVSQIWLIIKFEKKKKNALPNLLPELIYCHCDLCFLLAIIQKRLKKEKKAKRKLQEALEYESKRREQVEQTLKQPSPSDSMRSLNGQKAPNITFSPFYVSQMYCYLCSTLQKTSSRLELIHIFSRYNRKVQCVLLGFYVTDKQHEAAHNGEKAFAAADLALAVQTFFQDGSVFSSIPPPRPF